MANPIGEAGSEGLRLDFDRRLMLQFRGSVITSDGGLLVYRELDDTLGLTDTGADTLADVRTGKNGRHLLVGLLRQSVFGRLAGYEDVNDAEQLCRDPAMRWVVGDRAIQGRNHVCPHSRFFCRKTQIPLRIDLMDEGQWWLSQSYSLRLLPGPAAANAALNRALTATKLERIMLRLPIGNLLAVG